MRQRGVVARFADVRDLRIGEDESGARRLCDAAGPIDCVWRRAVTGELWDKPCDGRSALIEAAQKDLRASSVDLERGRVRLRPYLRFCGLGPVSPC